jgi:hypothetical protein
LCTRGTMRFMDAQSCSHPISALVDATAELEQDRVTVRAACGQCLTPIVKQFLTRVPEPPGGLTTPISELPLMPGSNDLPARAGRSRR